MVVAARAVQGGLRAGSKVLVLPIGDVTTVRVCMGVYVCRGYMYARRLSFVLSRTHLPCYHMYIT